MAKRVIRSSFTEVPIGFISARYSDTAAFHVALSNYTDLHYRVSRGYFEEPLDELQFTAGSLIDQAGYLTEPRYISKHLAIPEGYPL